MPGPPGGHRRTPGRVAVSGPRAVTWLPKLSPDQAGLQVPFQNMPEPLSPTRLAQRPKLKRQKQSWRLSKEEE